MSIEINKHKHRPQQSSILGEEPPETRGENRCISANNKRTIIQAPVDKAL